MTTSIVLPAAPMTVSDQAPPQDHGLVSSAREGDREAFEILVRRHERRVFRLCGRFFRRPEDVEEAAQETFLRAWSRLDRYHARAPFEHWLTRVCLNACYDRLRRIRPATEPWHDRHGGSHRVEPGDRIEVERLLARLDPRDAFLLLALDGQGWTVAEAAERTGWSRVNVKVRAHRARKRLRKLLEVDG